MINKINSISLTNANQEYSLSLTNVRNLSFKVLSGGSIRYAYESGKVATPTLPYYSLDISAEENEDFSFNDFTGTLYLASSTAATVVAVKTWS